MAERKPMPARRLERLMLSLRASSRSGGRRSPGWSSPLLISERTCSTTCMVSWLCPFVVVSLISFFTTQPCQCANFQKGNMLMLRVGRLRAVKVQRESMWLCLAGYTEPWNECLEDTERDDVSKTCHREDEQGVE